MLDKNFNGFKTFFLEQRFSNFTRTLMNKFNIDVKDTGSKMGGIPITPNILKFQLKEKPPWEDDTWDNNVIKWYEIIEIGENSAKIKEITGKCDNSSGGNTQNVMSQCSPTSGQLLTITGKQLDWMMAHVSSGQPGGGMGGGMGGMI